MNPLSSHHLTVLDASPLELIDIAAKTGCQQVCEFVHTSAPEQGEFPLRAFLNCAPAGVTIDVEVPQRAGFLVGVSPLWRPRGL